MNDNSALPPLRGARQAHQYIHMDVAGVQDDWLRSRYITPAFSGIPKQRGTKSELAPSPLPSRGPKRWQKCYIIPAFSGIPKQRGAESELSPHHCLLRGPKDGTHATSPLHSQGSSNKGGHNQNWLPHAYLLRGPKEGGRAMSPVHSWGSPTRGTKSKVVALGARTRLWMCSPKGYHQKNFSQEWRVCVEKHP